VQATGALKEAVGAALGDKKPETEGKTNRAAGTIQNVVGGLKDAVRGKQAVPMNRRSDPARHPRELVLIVVVVVLLFGSGGYWGRRRVHW